MGVARGLQERAAPSGTAPVLVAVAVVAALCLVALGIAVTGTSAPLPADDALLAAAGGPRPELWTWALRIDSLGEPLGAATVAAVVVVVCGVLHRWRLALLAAAAQGAVGVAIILVKPVFDRTIHGDHFAYPSGHTAGATAFAVVVGLLVVGLLRLGRVGCLLVLTGLALAAAAVAGWAQTVLTAHYATDTVGGFFLALAVVPPLALLVDLLADRPLHRFLPARPVPAPAPSAPAPDVSPRSVSAAQPLVTPHGSPATYQECDRGAECDEE